jgi:hypothetical protein
MLCSLGDCWAARDVRAPFPARYFIGFMHGLQQRGESVMDRVSNIAFRHFFSFEGYNTS